MLRLSAKIINITDSSIEAYPGDDQGNSIVVTSEGMAGKGETAQNYGLSGIISNPPNDDKGLVITIGNLDVLLGALNYQVDAPANRGETKIYSTDENGVEKATINLLNDGTIEINGNADNAVSYQDLKDALDNFKTSIQTAIDTAITGHTHTGVTPGPSSTGSGVGAPSNITIDISGSKVDEVLLP